MCRNIRPLNNFAPPATTDEVRAAALQYVRKVSGTTKPSAANQEAFDRAVEEVAHVTAHLLDALVTTAPPKDREVEAAKARARVGRALRPGRLSRAARCAQHRGHAGARRGTRDWCYRRVARPDGRWCDPGHVDRDTPETFSDAHGVDGVRAGQRARRAADPAVVHRLLHRLCTRRPGVLHTLSPGCAQPFGRCRRLGLGFASGAPTVSRGRLSVGSGVLLPGPDRPGRSSGRSSPAHAGREGLSGCPSRS